MDTNNSEEPDVKKRKTATHDSTTFKTDASSPLTVDSFDSSIVIRFASYLCSRDLVNLSLTCRRFGSKNVDTGSSLMEDAARQIICNATEDERDNFPADQTYIELYSELEQYRGPRVFDQLIGEDISYAETDKSNVKLHGDNEDDKPSNTAISNHVMRSGQHYVTFTKEVSNAYWNS